MKVKVASPKERKHRKVALLWTVRQANSGYFEVTNAYLEHASCCLGLSHAESVLILLLMRYRSLTLSKRRRAAGFQEETGPPLDQQDKDHPWPGKRTIADALGVTPRYVAALAMKLEQRKLLRRIYRRDEDEGSNTNLWDVTPLLRELDRHLKLHEEERKKTKTCPCAKSHERKNKRLSQ